MGIPDIRISRVTGALAVRWPGDEAWYRIEHAVVSDDNPRETLVTSDRFRVGPGAWESTPDEEWFDPRHEQP